MTHDATRVPRGSQRFSGTASARVPGYSLLNPARGASVRNRGDGIIYVAFNRTARARGEDALDPGDEIEAVEDIAQVSILVPDGVSPDPDTGVVWTASIAMDSPRYL